jgi:hypothetical protein
MMLKIGIAITLIGLAFVALAVAQRRTPFNDGPDNRPGYYKAPGVSLWPYEMKKIVRHGQGRAWIDIWRNGESVTDAGGTKSDEWLDVILWSSVPIETLRIFDVKSDRLLLAKDGNDLLTCGHNGSRTTAFPKRYVICAIDVPGSDALLRIEVTDAAVNEFEYLKDANRVTRP